MTKDRGGSLMMTLGGLSLEGRRGVRSLDPL
jgi:hypothetical protein